MRRRHLSLLAVAALACAVLGSTDASAFPHVASRDETLAQMAIRVYGAPRFETALVGANALDVHGGSAVVPGQPLEIPAPTYVRVAEGDTWPSLARSHLGDAKRADTLARANAAVSWVPPVAGREIVVPAVVGHLVAEGETMPALAQRYLGDGNKAWELDAYNGRKGEQRLLRGEVVLVPLFDLVLTEEGKREAHAAAERLRLQGGGRAHAAQKVAEAEIPPLLADVRSGRYVDAVAKGNKLLGSGELTRPQLATIHRALLEAYVALDAIGLASGACAAFREHSAQAKREGAAGEPSHADPRTAVNLDPKLVSPKIRAACGAR